MKQMYTRRFVIMEKATTRTLELETKVAIDYANAKFYNHKEGPYLLALSH